MGGITKSLDAGDDDLLARREALENLHFRDAHGADSNRPARGRVVIDDVGHIVRHR